MFENHEVKPSITYKDLNTIAIFSSALLFMYTPLALLIGGIFIEMFFPNLDDKMSYYAAALISLPLINFFLIRLLCKAVAVDASKRGVSKDLLR